MPFLSFDTFFYACSIVLSTRREAPLMAYRKIFLNYPVKAVQFVTLKKIPWELRAMAGRTWKILIFTGTMELIPAAIQEAIRRNKIIGEKSLRGQYYHSTLCPGHFSWYLKRISYGNTLEMIIALEMDL